MTEYDKLSGPELKAAFLNVSEQFVLFDTCGIYQPPLGATSFSNPDGWFQTYAAMGAVNEVSFFNMRNRTAGLMWNNQDKRDQLAWPFEIHSLGISFNAQPITGAPSFTTTEGFSPEDAASAMFMNDLPRHCGVTLRVQQDDRLKTHAFFCSPGYGPCGDGYGRGSPSSWLDAAGGSDVDNGYDHILSVDTQGTPILNNRWMFPITLQVPRTASLSVTLNFNEYGRNMLQNLPWLPHWQGTDDGQGDGVVDFAAFSAIQVTLLGKRLVQRRGQYFR